jgi:predicted Zn-dependent peptidase
VLVEKSVTSSGITVVTEVMPSVRSVAIGAWVSVGSRDEGPGEHGCSHFLEHLLFKGTGRRTARDIAEELDAVGGELNAFTARELTCFHARVLDRDLPLAIDVLGDMLRDATNAERDVDAEREVVLSELAIHDDTPDDVVITDLTELVLGDHPLALDALGTFDSVTGMPRDTIDDFYRAHYRPSTLVVAAAGHVDHAEVVRLVDEHLGDLGRPGGERPVRTAPVDPPVGRRVRTRPGEQVHVAVGGPAPAGGDPRRDALRVLDTLVGGGMSSRLFQAIREDRGLAYTTYSWASGWSDAGMWGAYAGVAPRRLDELVEVLTTELDALVDGITVEEVERAKGALQGGLVLGLEDPGSRMSMLGRWTAVGRELEDVDQLLARIRAVDLDAVRSVAGELHERPRHLAVVGPVDDADAPGV